MTRGELYNIYSELSNKEKRGIAEELGYSGCQGLVRFLSYNPSDNLENRYVHSVIKVIGMERLISIENKDKSVIIECKKQLIREILKAEDTELLNDTLEDISEAINSQKLRIESMSKIQ